MTHNVRVSRMNKFAGEINRVDSSSVGARERAHQLSDYFVSTGIKDNHECPTGWCACTSTRKTWSWTISVRYIMSTQTAQATPEKRDFGFSSKIIRRKWDNKIILLLQNVLLRQQTRGCLNHFFLFK